MSKYVPFYKLNIIGITFLLFFHFLFCSSNVHSSQQKNVLKKARSEKLELEIKRIINDTLLKPCLIGIKIVSLRNEKVLFEYNSDKLFHPASNMKILTTAAAINLLPSDFKLVTEIYSDGIIEGKTLKGNLCIKGSGDPTFTSSHLDSLILKLKQNNIDTITGDLVGDISLFDTVYWGKGWMWDDEPAPEEAFITPLCLNRNTIEISVYPGLNIGDTLSYEFNDKSSYFKIINNGITSNDTLISPCNVTRISRENTLYITGRIPIGGDVQKFTLSIWNPEKYLLEQFNNRLKENKILFSGNISIGNIDHNLNIAYNSTPIDSVIHRVNKFSDNLAAENLLKLLSSKNNKPPYSSAVGIQVINEFLSRNGIDTSMMILADGSGVSMYNLISPNALVTLLVNQYRNKKAFERFYESLSIAGIDGTLRNRLKGTTAQGNVHAKTGTLTGASAISGYVKNPTYGLIAFSIIINHCPCEPQIMRIAQDRILLILSSSNIK